MRRFLIPALLLLTVSCGPDPDDIFSKKISRKAAVSHLRGFNLKQLSVLTSEYISGERDVSESERALRTGLLLEAMLGMYGGRNVVLVHYRKLRKKGVPAGGVWKGFSSIGVLHRKWVEKTVFRPSGVSPDPRLASDLLAVLALHCGKEGRTLFLRAVEDYRLRPELFRTVLQLIPLKELEAVFDLSAPEVRKMALSRVSSRRRAGGKLLPYLKKLAASGLPVTAALYAGRAFSPVIRKYRSLPSGDPKRAGLRKRALSIYWFLTELRGRFKKRKEGEQMEYASILKKVYDVQSGQ